MMRSYACHIYRRCTVMGAAATPHHHTHCYIVCAGRWMNEIAGVPLDRQPELKRASLRAQSVSKLPPAAPLPTIGGAPSTAPKVV